MASEIKVDTIVNAGGDNDSGIDLSTNDIVAVKTANTERMRVDASGNVGIGNTSPDQLLNLGNTSSSQPILQFLSSTSGANTIHFGDGSSADAYRGYINYAHSNDSLQFATGGSERMRIDSSGHLLLGHTSTFSPISDGGSGVTLISTGQIFGGGISPVLYLNREDSNGDIAVFRKDGSGVGSISVTGSATAYNTSSDYRLKENVVTDWDATTRLKQLKPSRFNFIADADTTVDGFLAHEVSDVVPEAITGTKDAVDEDGTPEYQGIDQSKLVPLLTKALQEAMARIETLEAKVTALEGN